MEFVASTTFGTCLSGAPHVDNNYDYQMNVYHKQFLTWGFEKYLLRPTQTVNQLRINHLNLLIYSKVLFNSKIGFEKLESFQSLLRSQRYPSSQEESERISSQLLIAQRLVLSTSRGFHH